MSQRQQYTNAQLLLRSLTPSSVSGFLCFGIAFLLVAVNIVLRSVSVGTALPGFLDGQWAISYTENVVQPLTELLSSNTLNKLLIAGLWGGAGFVVYIGFEYAVHSLRSLHESQTNIRMARGGAIERPLANGFWTSVVWRAAVVIVAIVFLIAVQPLLSDAIGVAEVAVLSTNLTNDGLKVLRAIAEWTLILHGLVVLMRLYGRRTRLFGDDKLY